MSDFVSARDLRDYLQSPPRRLNLEASTVLRKLERLATAEGLRRVYRRTGGSVKMFDLISDEELGQRGFVETRHHACRIKADAPVKADRVTCWISENESSDELWVGTPLTP